MKPRVGRPDDVKRCVHARVLIERIDWPCDVRTNFSDQPWRRATDRDRPRLVFDQVDRAIVLEDGCVPHPSFFGFCQELLDRHRIIDGSARSLAAIL
jgi:hypothetical protein